MPATGQAEIPRTARVESPTSDIASVKAQKRRVSKTDQTARTLRIGNVLALVGKAMSHADFASSSFAVLTDLAKALKCQRVSLGFFGLRTLQVCAISNVSDFERRQSIVGAIEAAMEEAVDSGSIIVYPLPRAKADTHTFMHAALAKNGGGPSICTVPIVVRGNTIGALTFERSEGFDPVFMASAKDAACFLGPALEMQYRASRPIAGPLLRRRERLRRESPGKTLSTAETGALIAAGLLLIAAIWPVTLEVTSPARVEGAGQRVVAAPVDGFIQSVLHRPGDRVLAGELLVAMDDSDLRQATEKWRVETEQLDREYRDALSQDDAAEIVVARSRLDQAKGQYGLAVRELERSQLVAPIDGVLVSGDLRESIGMPVKRGQELLKVAPEDAYRIVAEVDEQDIALIQTGQTGRVIFSALSDQDLPVKVTRISPVARVLDHRNMFEVDGEIQASDVPLYHGLTGRARLEIDSRPLGQIVWLRIRQRIQKLTWRLIG